MRIILDTSVILKWFVDESGSDNARSYLQDFAEGKCQILLPTLLFYELGNACLYNSIPVDEIGGIMELLQTFSFDIEDIGKTAFRKIYQNASEYNLSFYDASYVTLMQRHDCEMVTADRKLFNKINRSFSKVKLLD